MFDLNTLSELSRTHCIAICAFLVPANLMATLITLIFAALRRPNADLGRWATVAIAPATVMVLHVFSWLSVGVVMAPTYILLFLATVCIALNLWAIAHSSSMSRLLNLAIVRVEAIVGVPIGAKLGLPPM